MNMKRRMSLTAVALVSMFLFTLVLGVTVSAEGTGASGSSSDSSSSTSKTTDGAINIVSYELRAYHSDKTSYNPTQITTGMSFDVLVVVNDTRLTMETDNIVPVAFLNTSSFQRAPGFTALPQGDSAAALGQPVQGLGNGISYQLVFPVKYSGKGNTFAFDLSYEGKTGIAMTSFSQTLNQCVEATSSSDISTSTSESSSTVTRGTGFVLKSVSYGDNNIAAGKEFTLNASLLSTNGTYSIENVSVGITPPTEITLATGSSIEYVGTVAPNQPIDVTFTLLAAADAKNGSYKVTINVTGIDAKEGTEVKASMDVAVPIIQPERFEVANIQMPDYLTANMDDGMGYGTASLRNKGKTTVSNVTARIEGEGLTTDEGDQFIGNIEPGTEKSADFNIHATTPGQVDAKLLITYENAKGEEITITEKFTLTVEEGGDISGGMIPPEMLLPEETTGMPVWAWLLIGLGVVGGVIVIIIVIVKKKKAKKAAAELEDEEDEDF